MGKLFIVIMLISVIGCGGDGGETTVVNNTTEEECVSCQVEITYKFSLGGGNYQIGVAVDRDTWMVYAPYNNIPYESICDTETCDQCEVYLAKKRQTALGYFFVIKVDRYIFYNYEIGDYVGVDEVCR